jgi:hypothetical protein
VRCGLTLSIANVSPQVARQSKSGPMKFPSDPNLKAQQDQAQQDQISAIQKRVSDDTNLVDRVYGGSAIRKIGLGLS